MKNLKEEYTEEGIVIGITIGKEEGIREGLINTVAIMKKIQVPENTIMAEIMEKFHLPEKEAFRFAQGVARSNTPSTTYFN